MKFEHRHEPLLPIRQYRRRQASYAGASFLLIGGSLALGMIGYHTIAHLNWIDSLLNASMILTGMGPVNPMQTDGAKIFASIYAIFSGVMFLTSVGVLAAPAVHRFLHRFHIDTDEDA